MKRIRSIEDDDEYEKKRRKAENIFSEIIGPEEPEGPDNEFIPLSKAKGPNFSSEEEDSDDDDDDDEEDLPVGVIDDRATLRNKHLNSHLGITVLENEGDYISFSLALFRALINYQKKLKKTKNETREIVEKIKNLGKMIAQCVNNKREVTTQMIELLPNRVFIVEVLQKCGVSKCPKRCMRCGSDKVVFQEVKNVNNNGNDYFNCRYQCKGKFNGKRCRKTYKVLVNTPFEDMRIEAKILMKCIVIMLTDVDVSYKSLFSSTGISQDTFAKLHNRLWETAGKVFTLFLPCISGDIEGDETWWKVRELKGTTQCVLGLGEKLTGVCVSTPVEGRSVEEFMKVFPYVCRRPHHTYKVTDSLKSYKRVSSCMQFRRHRQLNHSVSFVGKKGETTSVIEGYWGVQKGVSVKNAMSTTKMLNNYIRYRDWRTFVLFIGEGFVNAFMRVLGKWWNL